MGSRPCLVLVEWELLLTPLGWPMTEQTESCLFSGSVREEGKTESKREGRGLRTYNQLPDKTNKKCNKPMKTKFKKKKMFNRC